MGYLHNDNLPRGNIALQYVIQTIAGRSDGVSDDFLHFLQIKEKNCRSHQNYLVALTLFLT